jgi:hypothetical protein
MYYTTDEICNALSTGLGGSTSGQTSSHHIKGHRMPHYILLMKRLSLKASTQLNIEIKMCNKPQTTTTY